MATYNTLADLPEAKSIETWKAFIDRLTGVAEMGWLKSAIRHDIPALRSEDSPMLCVVKTAEDWQRRAVGKKPPYNAVYDMGLRLYLWDGDELNGEEVTLEQHEANYDMLERAHEVMLRVLRSEYMACNGGNWQLLTLAGGERNGRTSVIGKVDERLYMTTRVRLLRQFRPGQ